MKKSYYSVSQRGTFFTVFILILLIILTSCMSKKHLSDLTADYMLPNGLMKGYLTFRELPNSIALIPPPPEEGSTAFKLDQEVSRQLINSEDTTRWKQAVLDANLEFPEAIESFSAIVKISISKEETPYLYLLLQRSMTDAALSTYVGKNYYKRTRPFMVNEESTCIPELEEYLTDGSYPSGHAAVGWAWALILCELFPRESNILLDRGRAFGESRIVCNVHWQSDVNEGRFMGAATVARLHANPNFRADLEMARKEVGKLEEK